MEQPPIAQFQEDRETRLRGRRSGRTSYLVALPVVALVAAVAALGALGPRPAPGRTAGPSSAASTPPGGPSSSATALWTPKPRPTAGAPVAGLRNVALDQSKVIAAGFANGVIPWDAEEDRFLYAVGSDLYVSDLSGGGRVTYQVATVPPCGALVAAAMAGDRVIYSELDPAGSVFNGSDCSPLGQGSGWRVKIGGLMDSDGTDVATGSMGIGSESANGDTPVVDISDDGYAFARPDSQGETAVVEVHSIVDDRLLFASEQLPAPLQIHLADNRLVIETLGDKTSTRGTVLSTGTWASPLQLDDTADGPVSLGRDGTHLAYAACDLAGGCTLAIQGNGSRKVQIPDAPLSISIDGGAKESLGCVAWIAYAISGEEQQYLALSCAASQGPTALLGTDPPIWVHLQDDVLIWFSYSSDGTATLSRLDLSTAFPGP